MGVLGGDAGEGVIEQGRRVAELLQLVAAYRRLKRDLGLNEQTKDRWYRHWILEGFDALEAQRTEALRVHAEMHDARRTPRQRAASPSREDDAAAPADAAAAPAAAPAAPEAAPAAAAETL